jgi:hypothetical protein
MAAAAILFKLEWAVSQKMPLRSVAENLKIFVSPDAG